MEKVLTLKLNTKGRDLIVGDIHGNFHLLKKALKKVNFNPEVDRIIVAGDLVDIGQNSAIAKEWVEKDYFFSVMGNHDAPFAFKDDLDLFNHNMICMPFDTWFATLPEDEFTSFCDTFRKKLYPAIEIETESGLVGVVHAEIPDYHNWETLKEGLNNKDYTLFRKAMWNRDYARLAVAQRDNIDDYKDEFTVPDISHVFHGHTMSGKMNFKPYHIGNRYYIDTCSYKNYKNAGLSLFDIREPTKRILIVSN